MCILKNIMGDFDDDVFNDWTGEIFNNNYIMIKKLGFGSYASVWLSYDIDNFQYCAIKVHNRIDFKTGNKEMNVYKKIKEFKCKNLTNIYDSFIYEKSGKYFCCVIELLGSSLYDLIKQKTKFPLEFIINVIKQILEYLEILHDNRIIHGDIKPENILQAKLDDNIKKLIKKIDINSILQKHKFKKNKKNNQLTNEIRKLFCDSEDSEISENSDSSDTESEIMEIDDTSEYDGEDEDYDENIKISNIKPCIIKLIDIGTCVNQDTDTCKKTIQTCYYQSPEILLKLQYNEKCDIWALGCTIYELLTSKILFDADDYNGNENRYQIYLIVQKIGMIPQHMIKKSKYKQIIFTNNCKKIRGFTKINFSNTLRKELIDILSNYKLDEKKKLSFINLLLSFLEIDPEIRISAHNALQNEIFK